VHRVNFIRKRSLSSRAAVRGHLKGGKAAVLTQQRAIPQSSKMDRHFCRSAGGAVAIAAMEILSERTAVPLAFILSAVCT
jgi:hypothetical protein